MKKVCIVGIGGAGYRGSMISEIAQIVASQTETHTMKQYKYIPTYRDIEFKGKHKKHKS